jgi:hypothetical protein
MLSPEALQHDPWFNQQDKKGLDDALKTNKPFLDSSKGKLIVCQAILSPKPLLTVIGGIFGILRFLLCGIITFSFYPQNLLMLAKSANELSAELVAGGTRMNVLLVDDVASCEALVKAVVKSNL